MPVTSIGDARTPATPAEVTLAADTGVPSANQEVLLIGHMGTAGGDSPYLIKTINNSGDAVAAATEAATYFGTTGGAKCELTKMIVAAINANAGGSQFPRLKAIGLAAADTGFGTSDDALVAARNVKAEFIVSPYDGVSGVLSSPTATKLKTHVALVSGATRTANNQFGSFGVVANRAATSPANLPKYDSQYMLPVWLRDSLTPTYSLGELAAAAAARIAANAVPFNPLDDAVISGVAAPAYQPDWISVGDSAESETALQQGWTPLYVQPSGDVAFVRVITSRLSVDGSGSPVVASYFDVQDWQCLYYFRKTVYTRLKQPDFKKKASANVARRTKGELIRLAGLFEDQEMFQATAQLAKQFVVQRTATDRSAFEIKIPVNVVPGLHRKKVNIEAGTQFDTFVV